MDDRKTLPLDPDLYFYQENRMDELRHSFVLATEIEETREAIRMRDFKIVELKSLIAAAINERDEARETCKKLLIKKHLIHVEKHSAPESGVTSIEGGGGGGGGGGGSIGSSPPPELPEDPNGQLPEKGKFLEAVKKAGPLLQTLLHGGGPLPRWRNPPPPLDARLIPPPPVVVPAISTRQDLLHRNSINRIIRKRGQR